MPIEQLIKRFLIWRYKHISEKNFIILLSLIVGLLAGIVAVTIKNITFGIENMLKKGIYYSNAQLYFLLPFIGLLLVYLFTKYISKKPIEHAIPSILYALSKKGGKLAKTKIYYPLITAPLTVGFGGSVGLLGPAVGSASAVSSNIAQLLHVDRKTRTLLIGCAAAGAISSIFKSPIAAIIFAVEVFSLDLTFASLLPLLFASVASVLTSYFFLGDDLLFNFNFTDKFQIQDTLYYILLGVITAFASVYFTKMYFAIMHLFNKIKTPFQRLLIGGATIGIMLYFIPPLYGEGFGFINNLLAGNHFQALGETPFDSLKNNIWVIIALLIGITIFKAVAMTTTFAAGGVGGIFIPTMVMGSALGNVVAKIINNIGFGLQLSETNFTLVGMAGLIAGVIHAPLTAIFLIAEITGGYELFVPLMITASIAFVISKNTIPNNIYTRELAEKGALLTQDKDQNVLTLMNIHSVIEKNFKVLYPEMTLQELLYEGVAKSTRNIFPVINTKKEFLGIVLVDDIREVMFNQERYITTKVENYMHNAPEIINMNTDSMQQVMEKFNKTGAWNLPVIKNNKYYGFVSKSKLLTAYRKELINYTK